MVVFVVYLMRRLLAGLNVSVVFRCEKVKHASPDEVRPKSRIFIFATRDILASAFTTTSAIDN